MARFKVVIEDKDVVENLTFDSDTIIDEENDFIEGSLSDLIDAVLLSIRCEVDDTPVTVMRMRTFH